MSQALELKTESKINAIAVYSGAHPAHQRLLANCCSKNIKMLGEWSAGKQVSIRIKLRSYLSTAMMLRANKANVIIIEGTLPAALMAPVIKFLNRRPKQVIALCADDALYRAFVEASALTRIIIRHGFRSVSGIIAIGDLTAKLAKKHLKPLPIAVRYPPIPQDKVDKLSPIEPALNSHNLVLIGGGSQYCKGVDIAIKCLFELRQQFSDAKLTILGFHGIAEQPGIVSPGPVSDISSYLSSSSVLIHPVRGDAFPLVVAEAMLAGVVPFVSEWTGASSLAKQVSSELVVPLNAEEFAKRIIAFWTDTPNNRNAMSSKCKQVAQKFLVDGRNQPSLVKFIEKIRN
ncbi:MAG: glycosyltransferase [Firmicutes bacterium]|nr:glycosyltransferase [Bacillota bacterium]